MELRACHPLAAALALATLALAGCRDQPKPPLPVAGPTRPSFALPLAPGAAPGAPLAPTVDALPPASSPLTVMLDEGAERYQLIDQALAASEAFGETPPDYVVRYRGVPVSVWRAENGGIRAIERLTTGERAYFYRALTEQPYLVAGPGGAFGYDRSALAAAYDGDGFALDSLDAAHRVVAAARLLDRGRALHAPIMQARHRPAHDADWRLAKTAIVGQQLRWRQSLAQQADWRDWHEDETVDRETRWSAERQQRVAYAAALRAALASPRPRRQPQPVVALAAAPAEAAVPPPPVAQPKPAAAPPAAAAAPVKPSRRVTSAAAKPKARALRNDARPRKHASTAKAKRKLGKARKRLRRKPGRPVVRIERSARPERRHRTPKILRDVGDFFDRTLGARVHRGSHKPKAE